MSTSTTSTEPVDADVADDAAPERAETAHEGHEHGHAHEHLPHVTLHATGKRHFLHDVLDISLLMLIAVAGWFLWPASLGGSTRFIVVQGRSMEPVYHLGDAVIVKTLDNPEVGDIIVFHIPKGDPAAGMLVVHRIHAIRDDGTFQTKGDNRRYPDPFHITQKDIVGSPAWTLPNLGRLIGLASSPFVVGAAFGLVAMLYFLPQALKDGDKGDGEGDGDTEPDPDGARLDTDEPEPTEVDALDAFDAELERDRQSASDADR